MLEPTLLGPEIQKRRKKRGLTQEQLGAKLGVTAAAVFKWETGETLPDTTLLPGVCQVLGISPNELLGIDNTRLANRSSRLHQFGQPPNVDFTWTIFSIFGCSCNCWHHKRLPRLGWIHGWGLDRARSKVVGIT